MHRSLGSGNECCSGGYRPGLPQMTVAQNDYNWYCSWSSAGEDRLAMSVVKRRFPIQIVVEIGTIRNWIGRKSPRTDAVHRQANIAVERNVMIVCQNGLSKIGTAEDFSQYKIFQVDKVLSS